VSEKQVARAVGPVQLPRFAEPADERALSRRLRSIADSIHRAAIVSACVGQRQSNGVNSRKKVSNAVAAEVTRLKLKRLKARKRIAQGKRVASAALGTAFNTLISLSSSNKERAGVRSRLPTPNHNCAIASSGRRAILAHVSQAEPVISDPELKALEKEIKINWLEEAK
jgi:hypothetical protein